jgi:hypothetical protein
MMKDKAVWNCFWFELIFEVNWESKRERVDWFRTQSLVWRTPIFFFVFSQSQQTHRNQSWQRKNQSTVFSFLKLSKALFKKKVELCFLFFNSFDWTEKEKSKQKDFLKSLEWKKKKQRKPVINHFNQKTRSKSQPELRIEIGFWMKMKEAVDNVLLRFQAPSVVFEVTENCNVNCFLWQTQNPFFLVTFLWFKATWQLSQLQLSSLFHFDDFEIKSKQTIKHMNVNESELWLNEFQKTTKEKEKKVLNWDQQNKQRKQNNLQSNQSLKSKSIQNNKAHECEWSWEMKL